MGSPSHEWVRMDRGYAKRGRAIRDVCEVPHFADMKSCAYVCIHTYTYTHATFRLDEAQLLLVSIPSPRLPELQG